MVLVNRMHFPHFQGLGQHGQTLVIARRLGPLTLEQSDATKVKSRDTQHGEPNYSQNHYTVTMPPE